MPTLLWGEKLTDDQIDLFYFVNNLFRIDGIRQPLEVEVIEILTVLQNKKKVPELKGARGLFSNFADPNHSLTRSHYNRVQHKKDEMYKEVHDAWIQWIRRGGDANDRAIILKGV